MKRYAPLVLALFASVTILFACGYAGTPPNERQVSVSISPKSVTLGAGATQQFAATVKNTSNAAVTWQVNGVAGGGSATGTISSSGFYAAPAAPPASSVTVTAVSVADATASGAATVGFKSAPLNITLAPASASVPENGAQFFTATISGAGSNSVQLTWSVNGVANGNAANGTISANGSATALYAA